MYPFFPTFSLFRNLAGLSIRQAAGRIGISHTYLSQLEDFMVVPLPNMRTNSGSPLVTEAKYFISDFSKVVKVDTEHLLSKLSIKHDSAFFSLCESWWQNLLNDSNSQGRGPLLTFLLWSYFFERDAQQEVILFSPQKNRQEPLLPEVIANICERYYSAESFRRRKPRKWKLTPPLFKCREEFGVIFRSPIADSRQIFYSHPTSHYFALMLFYSLLRGINISVSGIDCISNDLTNSQYEEYESCYHLYNDYGKFSKFNYLRKTAPPVVKTQFTITPPAFRPLNIFENNNPAKETEFIPVPENTVIRVCLPDPFSSTEFCWCLTPTD